MVPCVMDVIVRSTLSKKSCCKIGKSVQGSNGVEYDLVLGLVMEPCVLSFLSI